MREIKIQLSDEEVKALEWDIVDIEEWASNAIHNKARQCIDKVIEEYSDKQLKKIGQVERDQIVRGAGVKSATERMAEEELLR